MIATDGNWNPDDRPTYFIAGDGDPARHGMNHPFVLIAVNEIIDGSGKVKAKIAGFLEELFEAGANVFIDSGVFWLTNRHKRAHDISMDEALALAPEEIDGFDWLWDGYLTVHERFVGQAWGFIELDQGGAENKRRTRAKLHAVGINPMPVYHPLNDGWDYFDELASEYDRLCLGNIVQADTEMRLRLIHTLAERHRAYPDLWVHILGYTPNQWANALPIDSADSSSWLEGPRWGIPNDKVLNRVFGKLTRGFLYRYGAPSTAPDGCFKAEQMAACSIEFQQRNWRHYADRRDELLGLERYPALTKEQP